MRATRVVVVVISLVLCPSLTGCLHSYRTASVQVRDATTGRPVPQVEVGVSYHSKVDPFAPTKSKTLTDSDGRAELEIAPYWNGKHLYVKSGDQYTFRDIDEAEVLRLPRRSLWPFSETQSRLAPDYVIEIPPITPSTIPTR